MGFSEFYLLIWAWFLNCCFSLSMDLTLVLLISATHNQINSDKAASGKRSKPLPIIVVALLQSIFNTSWEILFTPKWAQHLHPLLTVFEGPLSSLTVEERQSHCYCLQCPTWAAHLSSDCITDDFSPNLFFYSRIVLFCSNIPGMLSPQRLSTCYSPCLNQRVSTSCHQGILSPYLNL